MRPQDTTVLIIDDDPLHLTIYAWILEREGYKCRTTLVGSTSVELPINNVVNLILDYRLSSSLTAVNVSEQAKKAFPEAPIIVLSELPLDAGGHSLACDCVRKRRRSSSATGDNWCGTRAVLERKPSLR